jgi:hypothetical protein
MLNHIILIFVNVLAFIVIQTSFFYFIGSKQLNEIIANKVGIVKSYIKQDESYKSKVENYIKSKTIQDMLKKADEEEKTRTLQNIEVIKKWIGPPFIAVLSILIISIIILIATKSKWTGVDNVGISLVFTAYLTELFIFFGIIKQYEFLGDNTIYRFIYNLTKKMFKIN